MLNGNMLRTAAGAAMLGMVTLLGTDAAHAVIDLEDGTGAVTYARETLATRTFPRCG